MAAAVSPAVTAVCWRSWLQAFRGQRRKRTQPVHSLYLSRNGIDYAMPQTVGDLSILLAVLRSERDFGRDGDGADHPETPNYIRERAPKVPANGTGFRLNRFTDRLASGLFRRVGTRAVAVETGTPPLRPGRIGGIRVEEERSRWLQLLPPHRPRRAQLTQRVLQQEREGTSPFHRTARAHDGLRRLAQLCVIRGSKRG
jgi:hypothetical protein